MTHTGATGHCIRVAACCLLLLAAGCSSEPDTARRQIFALGTLVDITLYPTTQNTDAHFRAAETTLHAEEHRWSAWPGTTTAHDGALLALNRSLQAGESAQIPAELEAGIMQARTLAEQSGQRFNPAIGKLVAAWQFHIEERPPGPPPSADVISELTNAAPTLADLQQNESGAWRSNNPALYIDMGAFAKGLAVDATADALLESGVENGIVNAGGDLVVLGRHGDRAWRIGVRNPRGDGVLAAIEVSGRMAVFTSGDYERWFEYQGVRYHHILDPKTGRPARGTTSITVLHADAARADAAATALFVAGDAWREVARSMGIEKVMRVDAQGRISITRKLHEAISFPDGEPENIEVIN